MEEKSSLNKKLLAITALVFLFVIVVLVWYFFYAKETITPSLGTTNNPFNIIEKIPGSSFIFKEDEEETPSSFTEISNTPEDPLIQLWNKPASGQTFTTTQILKEETATTTKGTSTVSITRTIRASSTAVMFVDRATGYIYAYSFESRALFQVTNSLIPGVYDAYIFNNGKRVIMRYFDKEKDQTVAIIANVPPLNEKNPAEPLEQIEYLNSSVDSVAVNAQSQEASFVVVTENGSSVYTVKDKDPVFVTSSPFREWVIAYGGEKLYVTSKASAYITGSTLSLPLFSPEIIEKTGLVTIPGPNGVLFSSMLSKNGLITFFSKNNIISTISTKTIASKCAFGSGVFFVCGIPEILYKSKENLPDDWYQGSVSFNDGLYSIDPITGGESLIYSFSKEDGAMDMTHITIHSSNRFISFINKKDATLWLLSLDLIKEEETITE